MVIENPFTIKLPSNTLKFLLLNLYGHDIWHDFGNLAKNFFNEIKGGIGSKSLLLNLRKYLTPLIKGGTDTQLSNTTRKQLGGGVQIRQSSFRKKRAIYPHIKNFFFPKQSSKKPEKGKTPATLRRKKSSQKFISVREKQVQSRKNLLLSLHNKIKKEIENNEKRNDNFKEIINQLRENIYQLILYILGFLPPDLKVDNKSIDLAFDKALIEAESPTSLEYKFIEIIKKKINKSERTISSSYLDRLSGKSNGLINDLIVSLYVEFCKESDFPCYYQTPYSGILKGGVYSDSHPGASAHKLQKTQHRDDTGTVSGTLDSSSDDSDNDLSSDSLKRKVHAPSIPPGPAGPSGPPATPDKQEAPPAAKRPVEEAAEPEAKKPKPTVPVPAEPSSSDLKSPPPPPPPPPPGSGLSPIGEPLPSTLIDLPPIGILPESSRKATIFKESKSLIDAKGKIKKLIKYREVINVEALKDELNIAINLIVTENNKPLASTITLLNKAIDVYNQQIVEYNRLTTNIARKQFIAERVKLYNQAEEKEVAKAVAKAAAKAAKAAFFAITGPVGRATDRGATNIGEREVNEKMLTDLFNNISPFDIDNKELAEEIKKYKSLPKGVRERAVDVRDAVNELEKKIKEVLYEAGSSKIIFKGNEKNIAEEIKSFLEKRNTMEDARADTTTKEDKQKDKNFGDLLDKINKIKNKARDYHSTILVDKLNPVLDAGKTILAQRKAAAAGDEDSFPDEVVSDLRRQSNSLIKVLITKLLDWIKPEVHSAPTDDIISTLLGKETEILKKLIDPDQPNPSPDARILDEFRKLFDTEDQKKIYNVSSKRVQKLGETNPSRVERQEFDKTFENEFQTLLNLDTAATAAAAAADENLSLPKVIVSNAGFAFSRFGPISVGDRLPTSHYLHNRRLCTLSTLLDPATPYKGGGCDFVHSQRRGIAAADDDDDDDDDVADEDDDDDEEKASVGSGAARAGLEYASMHVILEDEEGSGISAHICPKRLFYDFHVMLNPGDPKIINSVNVKCNLPCHNNSSSKTLNVDVKKEIDLTKTILVLSKKNVYRNLVQTVIKKFDGKSTILGGQVWNDVFKNEEFIIDLFNDISAKGLGDFSQELSTSLKYGTYIKDNEETGELGEPHYLPVDLNVFKYGKHGEVPEREVGDAWRIFLANDGPSAIRFMVMLLFFPKEVINKKASGGYLTTNEYIVAKPCRSSLHLPHPPCPQGQAGTSGVKKGGRSPKELKDKQKTPKRKTKKHKIK